MMKANTFRKVTNGCIFTLKLITTLLLYIHLSLCLQFSGSSIFTDSSPPPPAPDPPVVTTTTTIPESELKCDEMFEAIVPADDNDDRIVTTTSSLNTVGHDQLEQIEEEVEGQQQEPMSAAAGLNCMQQMGSNGQSSRHHHQLHSQSHHHHPGLQQQWRGPSPPQQCMPPVAFLPFSPEDSPTPLGPNLQNTAEISSPEQVPLPSSTVSALPIPDTISPELLQLPHCFQLWFSSNGSPCPDSTSSGCLMSPLSPYLPPPLAIAGEHTPHCPPVYQELEP